MAQVARKARRGLGAQEARGRAEGQRQHRKHDEEKTCFHNAGQRRAVFDRIDHVGRDKGDHDLDKHLENDENDREDRGRFEFPHAAKQLFEILHRIIPPLRSIRRRQMI